MTEENNTKPEATPIGAEELEKLRKQAGERDQYLDLAARTRAEFENYQKRMQRERDAVFDQIRRRRRFQLDRIASRQARATPQPTPQPTEARIVAAAFADQRVSGADCRIGVHARARDAQPAS